MSWARINVLFALALIVWLEPPAPAQEPTPELTKEDEFWFSTPRRKVATAAQLILAQDPLTAATLRHKTFLEMTWGDLEALGDVLPPLNAEVLLNVKDNRPLPDLRHLTKGEIPKASLAIYHAYNEAVVNSFRNSLELFKKAAKENEHLRFSHLWNEPALHRGKVITVKGRLVRVRKLEAPTDAWKEGVKDIYEGWLFGETRGSHPYCIPASRSTATT